jgi:hypothetical protein
MQERIKYAFANSVNPAVLSAVSNIFRVGVQEQLPRGGTLRGSASTLGTIEEGISGSSRRQISALEVRQLRIIITDRIILICLSVAGRRYARSRKSTSVLPTWATKPD